MGSPPEGPGNDSGSHVVRLVVGYRGTRYAGWASQPTRQTRGLATIQQVLERALALVVGHPARVTAAGRTDAGVHADGQVVSFVTSSAISPRGLRLALLPYLPDDIWIVDAAYAARGFDARLSTDRRWYRYTIWRAPAVPARWQARCLLWEDPLDLAAMRIATRATLGRWDAAALATGWGKDGAPHRTTVRTIWAADWLADPNQPRLTFEVCADAFLRQMVRTLVSALLRVGQSRWSPADFADALATRDRGRMGPPAPAHGLSLWRIDYPPHLVDIHPGGGLSTTA